MILRKRLLRASRDNPVRWGAGRRLRVSCCGNLWWTMGPQVESGVHLARGETKHHDSIGAGYTDLGGWRERLS